MHTPPAIARMCERERESVFVYLFFCVCVCARGIGRERRVRVCESLTYWYVREIVEALTHCVLADSRLSHTYCFTYIVVCEHSALAVSLLLA